MFGLSFLNPLLLIGVLASVIPLLIHFLTKKEPKIQIFSTLRFLKEAAETVQQRWKMRNYLLLFLRMLIVFLLAVLFARPAVTRSTAAESRNLGLIIDNSPSMAYLTADKSRFIIAKEMSKELLGKLDENSRVVITALIGGAGEELKAEKISMSIFEKIDKIDLGQTSGDFWSALSSVVNFASDQKIKLDEVYFITDRQEAVFGAQEHFRPEELSVPVIVLLAGEENYRNAAVLSLESRSSLHYVGLAESFKTELGYWSFPPKSKANVLAVSIDGNKILQTQLDLNETTTTRNFNHTFSNPGEHWITVELEDDGMLIDNRYRLSVDVKPRPRVLLVTDDEADSEEKGAYYLKRALTISFTSKERLIDLLVITPDRLQTHILDNFNLIIYADFRKLNRSGRILLEDYAAAGGSLLLFPSSETDLTELNSEYFGANRRYQGFLPARLEKQLRPAKPLRLLVEDWEHPIFKGLAAEKESVFATANFYQYISFVGDFSPGVEVLMRYTNQAPAMLKKKFGTGQVVFFTSVLGGDWNNLVASPEFLPWIFQLTYYLSTQTQGNENPVADKVVSARDIAENFPVREANMTMMSFEGLQQKFPQIEWHFEKPEVQKTETSFTVIRREIVLPLLLLIILLLLLEGTLTHRPKTYYEQTKFNF